MTENVLLHACCGPCAEYPLQMLIAEEGLRPLLFFYNPNIHPQVEWQRRRDGLQQLAALRGLKVLVEADYAENEWVNYDPAQHDGLSRCQMCYETRLDRTAAKAKELGLPAFTTTLLVSPYQDHDELVRQGLAAAARHGVEFLVRDFRSGFRVGQNQAREDGLYRQKYCGCRPSLEQSDFKEKILKSQAAWLVEHGQSQD